MQKEDKVLDAITLDDFPDDSAYLGLVERYIDAGQTERDAIHNTLLAGRELGGIFYISKIDTVYDKARRRLALADLDSGDSYQDIARRYDFSEQTIRQLQRDRREAAMKKKQLKLFGNTQGHPGCSARGADFE